MKGYALVLLCLLLGVGTAASARMTVTPPQPTSADRVTVAVNGLMIPVWLTWNTTFVRAAYEVLVDIHIYDPDPWSYFLDMSPWRNAHEVGRHPACHYPDFVVSLGWLPPGAYTVRVRYRFNGGTPQSLGNPESFTVTAAEPDGGDDPLWPSWWSSFRSGTFPW